MLLLVSNESSFNTKVHFISLKKTKNDLLKSVKKILGAVQVIVNMIITILFANEESLSCFEGLIVQPVFQAFLGFLVMATAVVDTPGKNFEI